MSFAADPLKALKQELNWAKEGPAPLPGRVHLKWAALDDWSDLDKLVWKRMAAVRIDGDLLFGADLEGLPARGYLVSRNPRFVFLRIIDSVTGFRESVACIRKDVAPSDAELNSLGYIAADLPDSGLTDRFQSTIVTSSQSPRAAHRED